MTWNEPLATTLPALLHVLHLSLERSIDELVEVSTTTLGPVALAAARTMESELGSWRATSLSRPLERV